MTTCALCGINTPKDYILEDGKLLCIECGKNHLQKLKNSYLELEIEINRLNYALKILEQKVCHHKNIDETGYGKLVDSKWKIVCRCRDCGKEILKPFYYNY